MTEIVNISKCNFIRIFEKAFHYTPMAYFKKYQILCSFKLLWVNKSTNETAKAVGFFSGIIFQKYSR